LLIFSFWQRQTPTTENSNYDIASSLPYHCGPYSLIEMMFFHKVLGSNDFYFKWTKEYAWRHYDKGRAFKASN